MSLARNRKLAAILFADVVGYTNLMQKNEEQALSHLQKFKSALETQVTQCQGEIIQFYGDGCLAVFDSAVDAVSCARNLQITYQEKPIVPVRIGVHSGDIVFREGNVFGDAVNLASRVESMGVPGAVLLSETVRYQIKNQPNFSLKLLGSFEFKNVEEPMNVYALANEGFPIPKREEMKGKFKKPIDKRKYSSRLLPLLFVFGLLLASITSYFWYQRSTAPETAIPENAMAIFPFEVKGGNDLQYLGEGMVDLIATQLEELPELQSVDPNLLFSQLDNTVLANKNLKEIGKMAADMGAEKFVLGTIITIDETFRIAASKYDTNGSLLTKQSVEGSTKKQLLQTVDQLVQKLIAEELATEGKELSSLAALMSNDFGSLKAYLLGEQAYRAGRYREAFADFEKATQLDTTFAMAWMKMVEAGIWNLDVPFEQAFSKWGQYKHKMPKKWQAYFDAYVLFGKADRTTGKAFKDLIQKYGFDREFVIGLGEFYFHLGPLFGESKLLSVPYLEQAYELDNSNSEALIHLGELAAYQNQENLTEALLEKADYDSEVYPALFASVLATKPSVADQEIEKLGNHQHFSSRQLFRLFQQNEAGHLDNHLLNRALQLFPNKQGQLVMQLWDNAQKGKEKATITNWKELTKIDQPFQPYHQLFTCMPASLMVDPVFSPFQSIYQELFDKTKNQSSPWEIFAAAKYALALNKEQAAERLQNRLVGLTKEAEVATEAYYFDYSLKAYQAYQRQDFAATKTYIDSAYQHAYGFLELQANIDKTILSVLLLIEEGNYPAAIDFLEANTQLTGSDFIQNLGTEFFQLYAQFLLSQLYEQVNNPTKALAKCDLLLNNLTTCDESYQHLMAETMERKQRMNRLLN